MAANRICTIDGCGKNAASKGYCWHHFNRLRRNGGPLLGRKTLNGEPENFMEVVRSYQGDECLLWPYGRDDFGYAVLRSRNINRLVCEMQNGVPGDGEQARHMCGNGHLGCVNKNHLKWGSVADNSRDMIDHGRSLRGKKNHNAKLSDEQVIEIRNLLGKIPQRKLGDMFGVTQGAIQGIKMGLTWSWLR